MLLKHYPLRAPQIECIVEYPKRGVWKVSTEDGDYGFKYFQTNSGFSVILQDWLQTKKLSPRVLRTNSDELYIMENEKCCFVSQWRDGVVTEKAKQYMKAVADFHSVAQGQFYNLAEKHALYGPRTKGAWMHIYLKKLGKLVLWSKEAESIQLKKAFSGIVLMCEQMIAELGALDLDSYIEESLRRQTVVHWDLHRGNIIFTPKESLIIDLDGASISFQVCDLHQVISDLFDIMALQPERLHRMLDVYFARFPHARSYKQIYFTVCQFPHYFWTIAERLVVLDGNVNLDSARLCEIFSIEQRKLALIKQWS